jgi:hypothetical protein
MDGTVLFQSVLEPGERLVWTGRYSRTPAGHILSLLIGVVLMTVVVNTFRKVIAARTEPLPMLLQVELGALAVLILFMMLWPFRQYFKMKEAAYAVTDRRLLVAVGPEREKMREVALNALNPVKVMQTRGLKVVFLTLRGQGETAPVWTFLGSGAIDKWGSHSWHVDDPESVCQVIETTRAGYARS